MSASRKSGHDELEAAMSARDPNGAFDLCQRDNVGPKQDGCTTPGSWLTFTANAL
jgi:hypothetical protein